MKLPALIVRCAVLAFATFLCFGVGLSAQLDPLPEQPALSGYCSCVCYSYPYWRMETVQAPASGYCSEFNGLPCTNVEPGPYPQPTYGDCTPL